jgi:hypothetical protein
MSFLFRVIFPGRPASTGGQVIITKYEQDLNVVGIGAGFALDHALIEE